MSNDLRKEAEEEIREAKREKLKSDIKTVLRELDAAKETVERLEDELEELEEKDVEDVEVSDFKSSFHP